jgi:hypothetical protein
MTAAPTHAVGTAGRLNEELLCTVVSRRGRPARSWAVPLPTRWRRDRPNGGARGLSGCHLRQVTRHPRGLPINVHLLQPSEFECRKPRSGFECPNMLFSHMDRLELHTWPCSDSRLWRAFACIFSCGRLSGSRESLSLRPRRASIDALAAFRLMEPVMAPLSVVCHLLSPVAPDHPQSGRAMELVSPGRVDRLLTSKGSGLSLAPLLLVEAGALDALAQPIRFQMVVARFAPYPASVITPAGSRPNHPLTSSICGTRYQASTGRQCPPKPTTN